MATFYSWIGLRDIERILSKKPDESPIGSMLLHRAYDQAILIKDYKEPGKPNLAEAKKETTQLVYEIGKFFKGEVIIKYVPLEDPTILADVYTATKSVIDEYPVDPFDPLDTDLNFTSGTPVMQAVMLLFSKDLNCRILSSSEQKGVVEQDFPFDLRAKFIPEADDTKSNVELLAEIVGQTVILFVGMFYGMPRLL
mgnify:CR=1 FL=1